MTTAEEKELVLLWTKAFLKGGICREGVNPTEAYSVVFGRTIHEQEKEKGYEVTRSSFYSPKHSFTSSKQGSTIVRRASSDSFHFANLDKSTKKPTKCYFQIRKGDGNNNGRITTEKNSKHHGRQIMNSKQDHTKAQDKRRRQMNYALEVNQSRRNSMELQIHSITRIVVQSFRKLINCERCALFLMDHCTNELYFKPVGNEIDTDPKEIRFPVSSGVAGWVATERQKLNIPNAYQDSRFNPNIDKQTSFRTRTILCMPVMSCNGHLFGVIQMVNKMKGDSKIIKKMAKKKKTDTNHHGYESCFESFSLEDETVLEKCCIQVSRALEPILITQSKGVNDRTIVSTNNQKFETIKQYEEPVTDISSKVAKQDTIEILNKNTKSSILPNKITGFEGSRRRSSVGSLVQFISAEAGKSYIRKPKRRESIIDGAGVNEAMAHFQFRSSSGPQISAKRGSKDRIIAASMRKRAIEYAKQRRASVL